MTPQNEDSADAASQSPEKNKGPIQTFRHRGAFIKLWEQEGENGSFVTASIGNTYKDKETGEFRDGYSLSENDMGNIDFLMPEARKEMAQWQDQYRQQQFETEALQNAQEQQVEEQEAKAHMEPEAPAQDAQEIQSDMAASRDQALEQAAPDQSEPSETMDHEPASGIEQ